MKLYNGTHLHKVFFAYIVLASMTKPKFTEATAEALSTWRINVAQNFNFLDQGSGVPLAVRPPESAP